ncbi:MAG TPA: MASE4 domain-containing protein [Candidatus Sulfotelmatobacter sp.]|nr:MASE4 domain-containing protein [Candidatus Sulfotelmatobacter sp.]
MSDGIAVGRIDAARDRPPAAVDPAPSRDASGGQIVFLSTAPAGRFEWRLAAVVVGLSLLVFAAAAPFARVPWRPVPAFIPIYQSALTVSDLVTAVLLYGQVSILRSRGLLILASGYLFTALMAVVHTLSFPGLFAPAGLLGADVQTTAWIYMFWHAGFPLAVIGHSLLGGRRGAAENFRMSPGFAIPGAVLAVLSLAGALTWLATAGDAVLPAIMVGNRQSSAMTGVVATVWALSPIGLVVLWRRRGYTVLDVWLMVVLAVWTFDVALSAALDAGRFDLGFYVGRIYGLLAASFVLAVMLLENTRLYGRLATAAATLERRVRARTLELEHSNAEERRARQDAVEAMRQLEKAQVMNQRIFETSVDLILVTNRHGMFLQVSPSVTPILGYQPGELVGRSAVEVLFPDDLENTRAEMRQARQGRLIRHFDCRYIHKSGRAVPLTWTGVWSDVEQRYYFTGRDMTERIAAEEQLRQAQKMEAVGQLTGGVAHDFNNLLGIVVGNLDLLHEQLPQQAEHAELLDEALSAALRGAEVTRQLLAFSRRQPLQPKLVEPNEIVRGMTKLLARAIGEHIRVRLDLPEDAWPVLIDPAQLESALLNLAVNARDAMPNGGTLTIETANFAFDAEEAHAHVEQEAGEYVMIAVSDTGTGMSPEIIARVFEPFFSTKGVGKGTGLGLSMVYGFVKQSGGNAKIYSEPGVGTTIRLYLPRAVVAAVAAAETEPMLAVARGGERILVVEDNEGLRRLGRRQLRQLGYETLEAANGVDALTVLEAGEPIDLLFTDIVMPGGVDGRELARRAAALRPGLKVLFTSGFTAAAGAELATELADRLISKPFRKAELARRVRAALDAAADGRPTSP